MVIQYSVELTEVTERVAVMMTEISNTFADSAKKARKAAQHARDAEPVDALKSMSDLAKDLKKKQIRVEEFMMILVDYVDEAKRLAQENKAPPKKKKKKAQKKKEQE